MLSKTIVFASLGSCEALLSSRSTDNLGLITKHDSEPDVVRGSDLSTVASEIESVIFDFPNTQATEDYYSLPLEDREDSLGRNTIDTGSGEMGFYTFTRESELDMPKPVLDIKNKKFEKTKHKNMGYYTDGGEGSKKKAEFVKMLRAVQMKERNANKLAEKILDWVPFMAENGAGEKIVRFGVTGANREQIYQAGEGDDKLFENFVETLNQHKDMVSNNVKFFAWMVPDSETNPELCEASMEKTSLQWLLGFGKFSPEVANQLQEFRANGQIKGQIGVGGSTTQIAIDGKENDQKFGYNSNCEYGLPAHKAAWMELHNAYEKEPSLEEFDLEETQRTDTLDEFNCQEIQEKHEAFEELVEQWDNELHKKFRELKTKVRKSMNDSTTDASAPVVKSGFMVAISASYHAMNATGKGNVDRIMKVSEAKQLLETKLYEIIVVTYDGIPDREKLEQKAIEKFLKKMDEGEVKQEIRAAGLVESCKKDAAKTQQEEVIRKHGMWNQVQDIVIDGHVTNIANIRQQIVLLSEFLADDVDIMFKRQWNVEGTQNQFVTGWPHGHYVMTTGLNKEEFDLSHLFDNVKIES